MIGDVASDAAICAQKLGNRTFGLRHPGLVEIEEFRRLIEVYLEPETPDLAHDLQRIADAVARRVWPLVDGWQRQTRTSEQTMSWIAQRLHEDWPEVARRLSLEQTGSETGWWPNLRRPRIYADFNNMDKEGRVRLTTAGTMADLKRLGIALRQGALVILYDEDQQARGTVRWSADEEIWVAEWTAAVAE